MATRTEPRPAAPHAADTHDRARRGVSARSMGRSSVETRSSVADRSRLAFESSGAYSTGAGGRVSRVFARAKRSSGSPRTTNPPISWRPSSVRREKPRSETHAEPDGAPSTGLPVGPERAFSGPPDAMSSGSISPSASASSWLEDEEPRRGEALDVFARSRRIARMEVRSTG